MFEHPASVLSPGPAEHLADFAPAHHENLLRTSPDLYSEMVRNVSAYGIYLLNRDGDIQSWNRGAADITGYSEREVLGKPGSMLYAESALRDAAPLKAITFARTNGHCREEQLRRKRRGEEYIARVTLDAIRDRNGGLTGFVEVFRDITERKLREESLFQSATRDALTGVHNRGHFTEMAALEIERARRFAEPLSVILLDIDHFKKINDGHGHDVGDQAIIALAQTCATHVRKIDYVGRVGGEEFAILLPRANKEPALEVARRLRLLVAELQVPALDKYISFTVSMGVATLRPQTRDLQELMRNADAALYRAKREGRNRVEAWFE